MGGFFEGLGQVAEGAMKGFEFAERMKDKISARKDKSDEKETLEAAKKAPKAYRKQKMSPMMSDAPIQSSGAQFNMPADLSANIGATNFTYDNNDADVQVTALKNGGMVRKYAGGGLVDMLQSDSFTKPKAGGFGGFARFAGPAPEQAMPYVEQGGEYGYLEQRPPQATPLQQATPVAQQVAPVSAPSNLPASNFTLPAGNYGDFSGLAKFATGKQYPQQTAQPLAPATPKTVAPLAQVAPVQQKAFGFGVAPPQAPKSLTPEQQAARALRASQGAKMVGSAPIAQQFAPSQTPFGGLRRAPIAGYAPSQTAFGGLRMDYQSPFNGGARVGAIPRFADGGLVNMAADPEALSYRTNNAEGTAGLSMMQPAAPTQPTAQPTAQQAAPEEAQQIDYFQTQKNQFKAGRDKARDLGNAKLFKEYDELVFQLNDNELKKRLPMARQMFESSGDFNAYQDAYNETHDDGYNIDSHTRNADGSYTLKMRDPSGNVQDMVMNKDQIEGMVYDLSDPAKRRAEQQAASKEAASAKFKTNEEIRKENSKNQTLSKDQVLVSPDGKQIASNRIAGSYDDIKTVTGGYLKQNPDGSEEFIRTDTKSPTDYELYKKDPKDYANFKQVGKDGTGGENGTGLKPSERLSAHKNINDMVMQAFGTLNDETGKVGSNAKVIDVSRRGERLFDANPNLPTQTIIEIAANGKDVWQQKRSKVDGSVIEVPMRQYKDQYYPYSLGGERPAKKEQPQAKPKANPTAKPKPQPQPSLSLVSEAQASEAPIQSAAPAEEQKIREKISAKDAYERMEKNRNERRLKNQSAQKEADQTKDSQSKERKLKMQQRAKEIEAFNNAQGRRN